MLGEGVIIRWEERKREARRQHGCGPHLLVLEDLKLVRLAFVRSLRTMQGLLHNNENS